MAGGSTTTDVSRAGGVSPAAGSMITNDVPPRFCGEDGRPVAYLAVGDPAARAAITHELQQHGCRVMPQPTGFHVIAAIADMIDGGDARLRPSLLVIDVWARGCSGLTIASGLRDLGVTIPIVLVRHANDDVVPGHAMPGVEVVAAAAAPRLVGERCRDHGRRASSPVAPS